MSTITISVITPIYRPEDFIYEYFDSLNRQTLDKSLFEVILVLNGPKDPYYDMINSYKKRYLNDLNIQIYYHEQRGIVPATNLGIDKAQGKYITFIDCDDYISEKFLESLYEYRNPNIIVLSNGLSVNEKTNDISYNTVVHQTFLSLSTNDKLMNVLEVRKLTNSAARKLIPINIIGDVRMENIHGFDSLFMFQIAKKHIKFRLSSNDAIYYTRIRNSSVSRRKRSLSFLIKEHSKLGFLILTTYLKTPSSYSFRFFAKTFAGCCKAFIFGVNQCKVFR